MDVLYPPCRDAAMVMIRFAVAKAIIRPELRLYSARPDQHDQVSAHPLIRQLRSA